MVNKKEGMASPSKDRDYKRKEEIEDLKRRISKLEEEYGDFEEEKPISKKESKKYVRVLVILIVILLVVDVISLIAYYKPDIAGFFKSDGKDDSGSNSNGSAVGGRCNDGTKEGECSTNKPYFCYEGQLLLNAPACGCPSGYVIDFRSCKKG